MTIELTISGTQRDWSTREGFLSLSWIGMSRWYDNYLRPWKMAHEVGREARPDWPRREDYGLTQAEVEEAEDAQIEGEPIPERARAYIAAQDAVLRWAPEYPGIPAWKLQTNDHWIITATECATALRAWEENGIVPTGRDAEPWLTFIELLRGAASGAGLVVS